MSQISPMNWYLIFFIQNINIMLITLLKLKINFKHKNLSSFMMKFYNLNMMNF